MSYVVLARKYRPRTFDDLVGQEPVSRTLQNALKSGRVAHAYIFSGPRGVGKTTTARILANCLNDPKGPSPSPTLDSEASQAISEGTSVDDVLEIDGASNRGIEQIRDLRDNAKYAPAKSRYRIYIIDEAHQITKDAFGALLKTLEEPPGHVVFMMATTEVHKIPAPILSRCQRFSLRPISPELVFNHLKKICQKEKIKVEEDALRNIVRFVDGSLRDALSLLDQALVYSPDGITSNSLRELLGLLPTELIRSMATVFKEGDPAKILQHVTGAIQDGVDLTQLAKDLQSHYHTLLLTRAGVQDPLLITGDEIQKEAGGYDFATLERCIRLLARAQEEMRRSETPRAVFEIYALKLGQKVLDPKVLVERLEQLEQKGGPAPTQFPAKTIPSKPAAAAPRVQNSAPIGFTPAPPPMPPPPPPPPAAMPTGTTATLTKPVSALIADLEAGWSHFVSEIQKSKQVLAVALQEGALSRSNVGVTLTFNKSFSQQLVEKSMRFIEDQMRAQFGGTVPIQTQFKPSPAAEKTARPAPPPPPIAEPPPPGEEILELEEVSAKDLGTDVQKAAEFFPGTLKKQAKPHE